MLFQDIHIEVGQPICIYYDNIGSIWVAVNPGTNPCTCHVAAYYRFTREKIENGELELKYIPTLQQLADILTKPLRRSLFEKFRNELNLVSIKSLVTDLEFFPLDLLYLLFILINEVRNQSIIESLLTLVRAFLDR